MEDNLLGRPVKRPTFFKVDGHRIQRCRRLSIACEDPFDPIALAWQKPEGNRFSS